MTDHVFRRELSDPKVGGIGDGGDHWHDPGGWGSVPSK